MVIDIQNAILNISEVTGEEKERVIADVIRCAGLDRKKVIKFLGE